MTEARRPPWLRVIEGERAHAEVVTPATPIATGPDVPSHLYDAIREAIPFILDASNRHARNSTIVGRPFAECAFLLYDRMMLAAQDPAAPFGPVWRGERLPSGAGIATLRRAELLDALAKDTEGGEVGRMRHTAMDGLATVVPGHVPCVYCRWAHGAVGRVTVVQVPLPAPAPPRPQERRLRLV